MQSTITARGQTVVPAVIRKQFQLGPADRLEWVLSDGDIRVIPVRSNPVEAFRGQGKGGSTARLLASRKKTCLKNETVLTGHVGLADAA